MPAKLLIFTAILLSAFHCMGDSTQLEMIASDFWEIPGKPGKITWVEIHRDKNSPDDNIFHASILARKKGAPPWEIEWVCAHIAITREALKRSAIRPLKIKGSYPERFFEAYKHWQDAEKEGKAAVCTTTIADFLKQQH